MQPFIIKASRMKHGNLSRTYIDNKYNNAAGGIVTVYQNCNYTGYAIALSPVIIHLHS